MGIRSNFVMHSSHSCAACRSHPSARAAGPVNQLVVYPATEAMPRNADFNVRVRIAGQTVAGSSRISREVAQGETPGLQLSGPSSPEPAKPLGRKLARVSMGPTELVHSFVRFFRRCRCLDHLTTKGPFNLRECGRCLRITPLVKGNTITFSLSQPRNLSVEINGDIFHTCNCSPIPSKSIVPIRMIQMSFTTAPESISGEGQCAKAEKRHLAGGALVRAHYSSTMPKMFRIVGRGILSQPTGRHRRTL